MEFEIKVNIGWIRAEENIDDMVKEELVAAIKNKIGTKIADMLHKEAMNAISYSVDAYIDDMLKRFLDRDFVVTDKFGNVVARYLNVEEMLKEKFDSFMTEKVDNKTGASKGSGSGSCSYSAIDRIEFMLNELIRPKFDQYKKLFDTAASNIEAKIKKDMEEQAATYMQDKISKSLTKIIKEQGA